MPACENKFKKLAIIGVGLIGGSLALALRTRGVAGSIVGVSRHKETLAKARARGAIDEGSLSLDIVAGADCVVLATPVETILRLAPKLASILSPSCIVTDVGGAKARIVEELQKIFPKFVGAHPMAGSEQRGIGQADADLFNGALCIVTPTSRTDKEALRTVERMWHETGARTTRMTPARHDVIIACVSHLPHAVAFSLMNSVPDVYLSYAASGLKDATRIAASDAEIWSGIFLNNRENVLKAVRVFGSNLKILERALAHDDAGALRNFLRRAAGKRRKLI